MIISHFRQDWYSALAWTFGHDRQIPHQHGVSLADSTPECAQIRGEPCGCKRRKSSIGDQLHPSGEMDMATYKLIGAAYSGAGGKKEEWLDNVEQVTDIAVFSYESYSGSFEVGQSTNVTALTRVWQEYFLEGKTSV